MADIMANNHSRPQSFASATKAGSSTALLGNGEGSFFKHIRFSGKAPGADHRGWMDESLGALEAEAFMVIAMLMALLYPAEFEALA